MKITFIFIFLSILFCACNSKMIPAATPVVNLLTKDSKGTAMLLGHCSPIALKQEPFNNWYDSAYRAYRPDPGSVGSLRMNLKNSVIEIFLGTWCGDSKREVPRLLKTLDEAGIDSSDIKLIMVDHESPSYKLSPQHEEKGKFIFRVPTAIIYKNGRESGRIIETPVESWEKDLVKITGNQSYIPRYNGANAWMRKVKNSNWSEAAIQKAAEKYRLLIPSPNQLNSMGYVFMDLKKNKAAIQTFLLNTILFPNDSNTWDSLAEAWSNTGNKTEAIKYYKKVLTLKPSDPNATAKLAELKK